MQDSVLTLGEKMVLAARLAAVEHLRQELAAGAAEAAAAAQRAATPVGDRSPAVGGGFMDDSDAVPLSQPVSQLLGECFREIAQSQPMPRPIRPATPGLGRRRKGAA